MKKSYEKTGVIIFTIIIFTLMEIIATLTFFNKKYRDYKVLSTIVITNLYTRSYINNVDYNLIKGSDYLYIDNKKIKYEIVNVEKNVLRQKNKWYHEITFKMKFSSKYKDNDTITISIYNRKKNLFNIFKKCWEDDI